MAERELRPIEMNRFALYKQKDGTYIIEEEPWLGSMKACAHAAKGRGLLRCFGSQDKVALEAVKARLENAKV